MAAKRQRVPQRTCIACRETTGKRGLIRIVRAAEGRIKVDPTGRANGRGAYLHALRACWEKALKSGTMNNALKLTPSEAELAELRQFAMTLPGEETSES